MNTSGNVFAHLGDDPSREHVTELLRAGDVRVERIVSHGQASPPGFWYDQHWAEWVVVLQGSAGLRIEGEVAPRRLHRGDYLHLPAHTRHRVVRPEPSFGRGVTRKSMEYVPWDVICCCGCSACRSRFSF